MDFYASIPGGGVGEAAALTATATALQIMVAQMIHDGN
jgi:hypothetical protein